MAKKETATSTFTQSMVVNHDEASKAIAANGHLVTYVVEGEPGVGKSSILKSIKNRFGDKFDYIYIDVPTKDIPDVALPAVDLEARMTRSLVNEIWLGSGRNKPKVIMLDEAFKGGDYVKLLINRLMLERIVGDYKLPEGSIVFATTNLSTDGVGDRSNGHTNSRVARLHMRKPNLEEWTAWAIKNEVDGSLLAWVQSRPDLFQSYTEWDNASSVSKDSESVLHYIFSPQTGNTKTYVAPRTLKLASDQMKSVNELGWNLTSICLAGTFGKKAALDFEAYAKLGMELPNFDDVLSNPEKTPLPKDNMAKLVFVYRSLNYIKKQENVEKYMTYMKRFNNPELVVTWVRSGVLREDISDWIISSKAVTNYVTKDEQGSFIWRANQS